MSLEPETLLDHYQILSLLGSGGMGEVYCALDTRLGRKVAIKVLLPSFAEDPERLARFRHEMRSLALLNHPNILQVFDTALHDGAPYLVMECLEGTPFRQHLDKGPIPVRKAVDIARQIAQGLAAAHEKGIIHRDLKPDNLFLLPDDRIKILDFGLAKQHHTDLPDTMDTSGGTSPGDPAGLTRTGIVLGTLAYLSPEQVAGQPADARSDIFTFGVVFWEMLYGTRPFRKDSSVETLHSILKDDPEPPPRPRHLPPALEMILLRCLEKDPRKRFQTSQDLAFALGALGDISRSSLSFSKQTKRLRKALPWRGLIAFTAAAALLIGTAAWLLPERLQKPQVRVHRLTYQNGRILNARLAPDHQTFLYSVSHQGGSPQVWMGRLDGVDLQRLPLRDNTSLLSISPSGELALLMDAPRDGPGVLVYASMTGGEPRMTQERIWSADWSPDGKELAIVREGESESLEYPIGHRLFKAPPRHRITFLRVSPEGDRVAFTTGRPGTLATVCVVDRAGHVRELTRGNWDSLVWHKEGKQLFLSALLPGDRQEVWTVDMKGKPRLIYASIGNLRVEDVTPEGRILASHLVERVGILAKLRGTEGEQECSGLHSSEVVDLSSDGTSILFAESREGSGPGGAYLRHAKDPGAIRLGNGSPFALSPDGQWTLVRRSDNENDLVLLPTGTGDPRQLFTQDVVPEWGCFVPGSRKLLISGTGAGKPFGFYYLDLDSAALERLPWEAPPGSKAYVSPNRTKVALSPSKGKVSVITLKDGQVQSFACGDGDQVLRWGEDDASLFLLSRSGILASILRMDLATGKRTLLKKLEPGRGVDLDGIPSAVLSPDGRFYAYSHTRVLSSDLYLLEGYRK